MENDKRAIPTQFHSLFWEVDPGTVDLETHANYVIERFLEYGTLEGVHWLRRTYSDMQIQQYILKRGYKVLSKKTLNFWKQILHLENEECLQPSSLNSSRPFWNY